MAPLEGRRIAVIGGDAREAVVSASLAAAGAEVRTYAVPRVSWLPEAARFAVDSPASAIRGCDALVLPMPGIGADGRVYAAGGGGPPLDSLFPHLAAGTVVVVGFARPALVETARAAGCPLETLADDEVLAYLNAVPTAEGAIALAIALTVETLFGSTGAVLGFGRTGRVLAAMLHGMGARVTVAARKAGDRAHATALGYAATDFQELPRALRGVLTVFNTVPAPVLDARALSALGPDAAVVDLASAPGGTDFDAARRLGVAAVLAPGLPGKRSPRSAGRNQAQVIVGRLIHHWAPLRAVAGRRG